MRTTTMIPGLRRPGTRTVNAVTKVMAVTALCFPLALSGCSANPGPPPLADPSDIESLTAASSSAAASTTTSNADDDGSAKDPIQSPTRTQVAVGVDPLSSGLNPHLMANNSQLVMDIADLTLPSAFHAGVMDTDLLDSAEEVPAPAGVAQRVEYTINSAAQWSDGAPITGADFIYLWHGMATTPGVKEPAGYRAISEITSTGGGRVVTVDFSQRVADWQLLFTHLLPSHLMISTDFSEALADAVPASAGRFLVASVDRARGIITLNRNDRFWGQQPARVDILTLRSVRSNSQAASMLRSQQVGFLDVLPQQTTAESLSLLPGVETVMQPTTRQLRLHIALDSTEARRELAGNLDVGQVARLATERATDLRVPYGGTRNPTDSTAALRALGHPVRIAVDPTDAVALNAAQTIADQLIAAGVEAAVLQDSLATVTDTLLPEGRVDAVVTWVDTSLTSMNMANAFLCGDEPTVVPTSALSGTASAAGTASPSGPAAGPASGSATATAVDPTAAEASQTPGPGAQTELQPAAWAGELSRHCPADAAQTRRKILAGEISPAAALDAVRELNDAENLYVPLLDETRIHAVGAGIVGPGPHIEDWHAGLATAASWEEVGRQQ